MVDVLTWLVAIEILGILAIPFCFTLFRWLPDRGLTLAKPLALILFSYLLWLAGLTQIIPNSRLTIIVILVLGAGVSGLVLRVWWERVWAFVREEWRTLVIAEALFLAFFFLWAGILSETPAITGTEKPMDFGFMNAVLQSRFFPPEDPWLLGSSISYYYYGHFMMAFMVKLSAVPPGVGYNLAVALIPALLAVGSFGLVYNLVRLSGGTRRAALVFGLAAPALIMLIGNLEGILEFIHAQGWGGDGFWSWVGIKGLEGGAASSGALPDDYLWWWRGTRVIDTLADGVSLDYTITEFPAFSFLLGDLHPHVMSLPFLVLGLSLALNLFRSEEPLGGRWLLRHPLQLGALALFIGSLAFINAWDLPLMAGVLMVLILVKGYRDRGGDVLKASLHGAVVLLPVLAFGVLLFLPFYLTFSGQALGIRPLEDHGTRPFLFFLAMGLFSVLAVSFVLRQASLLRWPKREEAHLAGVVVSVALAPFIVWIPLVLFLVGADDGLAAAFKEVGVRAAWVLPGLAIVAVAGFSAAQRLRYGEGTGAAFPLLLIAISFYLLASAELFYVNDSFGGPFRRMNTVFKVYYQAWLLLGLAGAYGLYYLKSHPLGHRPAASPVSMAKRLLLWRGLQASNLVWVGLVTLLVVASAYYSVGAVLNRTGLLDKNHTLSDNTLDGLAFINNQAPGEYQAIRWLRDDARWGRMVEAVGNDYTDYGRVSSSTGLPTLLGWKGHEVQWRGSSLPFRGREEAVAQIYQSENAGEVRQLLERFEVRYVYLGQRERRDYGGENLANFDGFLRTVFNCEGVVIYEVINGPASGAGECDG